MATNLQLKNAQPKNKDYTINVENGLSLLIKTTGVKLWRLRYSFAKKRCLLSLGKYPHISMKEAKTKQREYMDMLDKRINPSTHKQTQKIQLATQKDFKSIAHEWYTKHYLQINKNERHNTLTLRRLEKYIFPHIAKIPLKNIEAPMLFNIIEAVQERGTIETGKRINSTCSQIFRYGVAKGYCKRDITRDYTGMLKTQKSTNMPTLTDTKDIQEFLQDIQEYNGTLKIQSALKLLIYIFVRPSELANSKWEYIDFENSEWIIPAEYMKMKRDHLIPFPKQVKTILKQLEPITGHSEYILPNEKDETRPIHSESINKTIRRIEHGKYIGKIVSHGFRAMASTILNENKFRPDIIEKQLAHQERNKVRGAYNRAEYLEERTHMMQWYADYLDGLRDGK